MQNSEFGRFCCPSWLPGRKLSTAAGGNKCARSLGGGAGKRSVLVGKRLLPRAGGRGLAVFGGAVLKEVGVLHRVQHLVEPRQRVLGNVVERVEPELGQAAVGDV